MLRQEWDMGVMGDILYTASELPPEDRAAYIQEACAERAKLAAKVAQLNETYFAGEDSFKAFDRAEVKIQFNLSEATRMINQLGLRTLRF